MGYLSRKRARVAAAFLVTFAVVLVAAIVAPTEAYAATMGWVNYVTRWWDSASGTVQQGSGSAYCTDIDVGDDEVIDSGWYTSFGDDDDIDTVFVKEGATVNIILRDGVEQKCDGIHVPPSSTLNIYG